MNRFVRHFFTFSRTRSNRSRTIIIGRVKHIIVKDGLVCPHQLIVLEDSLGNNVEIGTSKYMSSRLAEIRAYHTMFVEVEIERHLFTQPSEGSVFGDFHMKDINYFLDLSDRDVEI